MSIVSSVWGVTNRPLSTVDTGAKRAACEIIALEIALESKRSVRV